MVAVEVLRLQPPTESRFKATDAETAAPSIDASGFPYTRSNEVDFRVFANRPLDATEGSERIFCALFARDARCGIHSAIDARITIGSVASRFRAVAFRQSKSQCLHMSPPLRCRSKADSGSADLL
jgi:hypothetical protein